MLYLVSFPRAGSTWVRLFFEKYTGKPSGSTYETPVWDTPILHDKGERCLIRTHRFRDERRITENDKVILLLRDPLNAIPSILKYHEKDTSPSNIDFYMADFLNTVIEYGKYQGRKMTLYYEDLCVNFDKYIHIVLEFAGLPVDEEKINTFMKQDEHNFTTYINYFRRHDKGNDIEHDKNVFNRKRVLSLEQRREIKKLIHRFMESNPLLADVVERYA